jgi:hypothetical protein
MIAISLVRVDELNNFDGIWNHKTIEDYLTILFIHKNRGFTAFLERQTSDSREYTIHDIFDDESREWTDSRDSS